MSRTPAVPLVQPILEKVAASHDLPTGIIHQEEKRELASDPIDHEAAPPMEEVKFAQLPPLYRSTVPVDQSRFYGSPYFLRHVGLDPGQRGTPDNPLRFLGDPFFEARLINDAIQKATARQLLYEDVATPEEQIKALIDNTAAVVKDWKVKGLKVGLGVTLTNQQIDSLQKDIIWYEEQTVKGHQVLVPQVYLSKETIASLRSKSTGCICSSGKITLNVEEKLTNTGTMSAKDQLTLRAQSLHQESFGSAQATIQSTKGGVDLVTQKNIDNISGKIGGAQETKIMSQEGAIHHTTKLLDGKTLGMQASIESGGSLIMQSKQDIVSQAAKIKSTGDANIHSEEGDVQFLTQKITTQTTTHSSSYDNRFLSSSRRSKTTAHSKAAHAVSELEIGGSVNMKGRDITFMVTQATVGKDMNLDASRDLKAVPVEETTETVTTTSRAKVDLGIFSSEMKVSSDRTYTKQEKQQLVNFNIGKKLTVKTGRNASMIGTNVTAEEADMSEVQGEIDIRDAYDTEETVSKSTSYSQEKNAFKSEQGKVELVGTQVDASQNVLLSGTKGVLILAAKEESSVRENRKTLELEVSIGLKNKFLALGNRGEETYEAYKGLKAAREAYNQYQKQLPYVEAQYKNGVIDQKEYEHYKSLNALHLAAIISASLKLTAKGKSVLDAAGSALASTNTLGFSLDVQGDI